MDQKDLICKAIHGHNYLRFKYLYLAPEWHLIEPYTLGHNLSGSLILHGWRWKGTVGELDSQGQREYLVEKISSIEIVPQTFEGYRDGYISVELKLRDIICDLLIPETRPRSTTSSL